MDWIAFRDGLIYTTVVVCVIGLMIIFVIDQRERKRRKKQDGLPCDSPSE